MKYNYPADRAKRWEKPQEIVAFIEIAFIVDGVFSDKEKHTLEKSIHDSIRTANIQGFLVNILSTMDTNIPNTHAERKIGNVEKFLLEKVMKKHSWWEVWSRVKLYDVTNFYLRYEQQKKKSKYNTSYREKDDGVFIDELTL
jgi:hypothetical protein